MTPSENTVQYRKTLKIYTIAVIIICTVLSFGALFIYQDVHQDWKYHSTERKNVYLTHQTLIRQLGYDGVIHHFKDLILTKNIDHERTIRIEIQEIYNTLDKLDVILNPDTYHQYIENIRQTMQLYEANAALAVKLIHENVNSQEIQLRTVVDDTEAFVSLIKLQQILETELETEQFDLTKKFNFAILMHLISVFLFGILLWIHFVQMQKSNQKEQYLADKAYKASKIKSDFLANMSHEIRTPLNGVMGMLHVLRRDIHDETQLQRVERALLSTKSLLTVLNDILDFSKIEANQLTLEQAEFSLDSVIESIMSSLSPVVNNTAIDLILDIEEDLPTIWIGDSVRINQILLNLVSNAVKFTLTGSVTIKIRSMTDPRIDNDESGLVFSIIDTGIGMTPDTQEHLFKRFSQADTSTTRTFGGTGLGMSITKNLVDLMKGSIDVQSEYNVGTEVNVWLPLKPAAQQTLPLLSDLESIPQIPQLSGKTILLAEDNHINQVIVKTMLEHTGADLIITNNGHKALDAYYNNKVDFIFMDIYMPVIDGTQACLAIRKDNKEIPIIALTANVMVNEVETYRQVGFTDHIGKPFSIVDLHRCLNKYIGD